MQAFVANIAEAYVQLRVTSGSPRPNRHPLTPWPLPCRFPWRLAETTGIGLSGGGANSTNTTFAQSSGVYHGHGHRGAQLPVMCRSMPATISRDSWLGSWHRVASVPVQPLVLRSESPWPATILAGPIRAPRERTRSWHISASSVVNAQDVLLLADEDATITARVGTASVGFGYSKTGASISASGGGCGIDQ